MSRRIQLRRGTALQHATFAGALAELTMSTDDKTLRLHDGATAGGIIVQSPLNDRLTAWALTQAFQVTGATRNADGALLTANIVWPDGKPGVFTADAVSTAFPGAVDAWHATYGTPTQKTVTQSPATRDANGFVVAPFPAITIA